MAFQTARARRTFNSASSSSGSSSSVPKSTTGKTSGGGDYSVVDGNEEATRRNLEKALALEGNSGGSMGSDIHPNEPTVLSSANGKKNFDSKVMPTINRANDAFKNSKKNKDLMDLNASNPQEDPNLLPPDVQAELDAEKSPEQQLQDKQTKLFDKQQKDAENTYKRLTLAASRSANARISTIMDSWAERKGDLQKSNKTNLATWQQSFIRSGQSEYSPGMSSDFLTAKEQEGLRKVKTLDDDYTNQIAEVNTALEEKNFALAADLSASLRDIEQKQLDQLDENIKETKKTNLELRVNDAIYNAFSQGLTDPTDVYYMLREQGIEVTPDAVSKALKIFSPDEDLSGLSSDYRTFKYLQDINDPAVEGLNYSEYVAMIANVKRKPTTKKGSDTTDETTDANGDGIQDDAPTWAEYVAAAEQLRMDAGETQNFSAEEAQELRAQYDETFSGGTSTIKEEKFTPTEMKKLEAAGLGSATREAQLKYLFPPKKESSTSGDREP